ncbi:MAG: hypothetical protein QOJ89_4748 [bacterium]
MARRAGVRQPRPTAYIAALDGVRGLSAVAVLVAHAALATGATRHGPLAEILSHLEVAVAMFFALSGYLIYRPFIAAQYGLRPQPRMRDYARRRGLRAVPAYWVALTFFLLVPGIASVVPELGKVDAKNAWIFYGFLQVYDGDLAIAGIGQAWTMCCEVAFYALIPVFALLVRRLGAGPKRLRLELALLLALGAASTVARVVVFGVAPDNGYPFALTPPATLLWLVAGMALATISIAAPDARPVAWIGRHPAASYALASALFVLNAVIGPVDSAARHTPLRFGLDYVAYAAIAFLVMAPAVLGTARSRVSALLSARPLRFLGRIAYGFYLWHIVILVLLMRHGATRLLGGDRAFASLVLSGLICSVIAGAVSYRLVERPLLERFSGRGRGPQRPAVRPLAESPASPRRAA